MPLTLFNTLFHCDGRMLGGSYLLYNIWRGDKGKRKVREVWSKRFYQKTSCTPLGTLCNTEKSYLCKVSAWRTFFKRITMKILKLGSKLIKNITVRHGESETSYTAAVSSEVIVPI